MADRIVFFGTIRRIEAGDRGNVTITLDGDQRLSVAQEYRPPLEELLHRRWPVYLETGELLDVTRVRLPRIVRVHTIEGTSVTFENSAVRAEAANDEVLSVLRKAAIARDPIAVTISDGFKVIDARPYHAHAPAPLAADVEAPAALDPFPQRDCITPQRAQELFCLCADLSCSPPDRPRGACIPFLYPDDGCWARAHEMTRLLIAAGANPLKVWIYGRLVTPTVNNPCCFVRWRFHVAPTVCVCVSPCRMEEQVIDPSLFTTPVSVATWASVQGDPAATFALTSPDVYWNVDGRQDTDPTHAQTNWWLDYFRLELQLRSLTADIGPPPYTCPPLRPCA